MSRAVRDMGTQPSGQRETFAHQLNQAREKHSCTTRGRAALQGRVKLWKHARGEGHEFRRLPSRWGDLNGDNTSSANRLAAVVQDRSSKLSRECLELLTLWLLGLGEMTRISLVCPHVSAKMTG